MATECEFCTGVQWSYLHYMEGSLGTRLGEWVTSEVDDIMGDMFVGGDGEEVESESVGDVVTSVLVEGKVQSRVCTYKHDEYHNPAHARVSNNLQTELP